MDDKKKISKKRVVAAIIVTVLLGVTIHACDDKSTGSEKGMPSGDVAGTSGGPMMTVATPVGVATVQKKDVKIILNALGTVTPLATTTVTPRLSGHITKIAFQEGQMVKVGDFLAQIDPRPYELALAESEGTLMRDQALLKDAKLTLERYKTLIDQESISKQQFDTQGALVDQYTGQVKTDQAQVDDARLNLSYCKITAPITGRVGLRAVDEGNYVSVGSSTGIVSITQTKPISALFALPEDNVPSLFRQVKAGVKLEVSAFDRKQKEKLASGVVASIDNQIATSTGTVKLRASFENADETLFPNQFVTIQVLLETLKNQMVVPSAAIQIGAAGPYVFLVKADDTVTIQTIETGAREGDTVSVTKGLSVGDKVVIDGVDHLKEGAKISMPEEKAKE